MDKTAEIRQLTEDAMEMVRGMVAIPSVTFEEDEVRAFISSRLDAFGLEHVVVRNNLIARSRDFDPARKTLMLNAHIDTVPANAEYEFDPFHPEEERVRAIFGLGPEDIVCGLGSNDDGGSVVSLTAAFRHFHDQPLPCNLVLVLSCEEERSGPDGMSWIWEHFNEIPGLETARKPSWAIIGEPTGMKAATSERGLLVIDGTAEGVSGHAARGEGINALYIAMDDINALRAHEFSKVSPEMGKVRLSVTQIDAGTAHNVIPDQCRFVVDIRPTDQYDNAEILADLQQLCKSTLKARNLKNKSSATAQDSPLRQCLAALDIPTFSSPTTSDWIRVGCDAVKMGPGDSSRSHRKNEYITREEIEGAITGYIGFLETFFRNPTE